MLPIRKTKNADGSYKLLIHVEELLKISQCAPIHIYQRLKRDKHLGWSRALLGATTHQDEKQRAGRDAREVPPGHEEQLIAARVSEHWNSLPRKPGVILATILCPVLQHGPV